MSHTSVKIAFALVVVLASVVASFAQHAGLATTRNAPITTLDSSRVEKCRQGNPATAATPDPAEFVHPGGVCRAPQNITDGPVA
jgi:hypothetical protein